MSRELNFLNVESEILSALLKSKEEGTSIGIKASPLGTEIIITAVEDIQFHEGQTIIVLKHFDLSGYILPSSKINLPDIQAVCPFASPFHNPYLQNLDRHRTWFF
jgi:hypothetical protein